MTGSLPSLKLEKELIREGYRDIAGIDEAGRGPLAGPVVACACILPEGVKFEGVNDSKKLTEAKRESLYEKIIAHPDVSYGVGIIVSEVIDEVNIYQATILAMLEAVKKLPKRPGFLLVDGLKLPHESIPSKKVIKGDQISHSIASASIIAKVTRDRLMSKYHEEYPQYGFIKHKGYGTKLHLDALQAIGPCPIHRRTFRGVLK